MIFGIYDKTSGEINRFVTCSYDQVTIQCGENEEFYLNCPLSATHIIDNEPVTQARIETPVVYTLDELKTQKLKYLASERFNTETSGIPIGNATILTDRESQSQLNSALSSLREGFVTGVKWKAANGTWVNIVLSDVLQISTLVSQHVQKCFARECELAQQVQAATTEEEVNSIEWTFEG